MRYEGVSPDTLIFPSRMGMYASLVPGSETEFYRKGPGAVANLETGPATFQTFRGLRVHESRPFDVDFIGEPYDLLVRERQIGDYHVVPDKEGLTGFYIYSMDSDKFENVLAQKKMTGKLKINSKLGSHKTTISSVLATSSAGHFEVITWPLRFG